MSETQSSVRNCLRWKTRKHYFEKRCFLSMFCRVSRNFSRHLLPPPSFRTILRRSPPLPLAQSILLNITFSYRKYTNYATTHVSRSTPVRQSTTITQSLWCHTSNLSGRIHYQPPSSHLGIRYVEHPWGSELVSASASSWTAYSNAFR